MARYGMIGTGLRIFALLLLVLVLLVGGVLWFDYLNLIDAREILDPILAPGLELLGLKRRAPIVGLEDPLLLERERLNAQKEALTLMVEDLEKRGGQIVERESELNQIQEELVEKEKALGEREKSFNERVKAYENKIVNLERKVTYFLGMPPEKAVAMMLEYESDMDIIDIFRMADEMASREGEASLVPYWLSLMPPERGAELTRKMGRVTVD
jgi:flagellar protein FlbB